MYGLPGSSGCRSWASSLSLFSQESVLSARQTSLENPHLGVGIAGTASSRSHETLRACQKNLRQNVNSAVFGLSVLHFFNRGIGYKDDRKCWVSVVRAECERVYPNMEGFARSYSRRATINWEENSAEEGSSDDGQTSGNDTSQAHDDRSVKWHVDKLCPTSLRVRQLKEVDFDDIIEREKKLKIVLKVKDLLLADPEDSMTLQDLGKCRDYIGLTGNKRIIAFLKRYPGVFTVHENVEPGKLPWFEFTAEADAICDEELEIRKNMKVEVVTKLRKLLMMSNDKRLLLGKVAHIARDLGLPEDFRQRLVHKYPRYFRVIEGEDATNEDGRILELVKWSDRLAVTEEEQRVRAVMEENSLDSPPRLEIQLPKRYRLSNKDKYVLYKFHELECPSPYEASNYLHPASPEAEKRAVLVIKELLALTLEKRLYVDHLTHFRKEFKFSNQVRGLLVRHPEHFYVSRKGARDTVFLRDAYEGIHEPGQRQRYILKVTHPLVTIKEKFLSLMEVKRVPATQQSVTRSDVLQDSLTSETDVELLPQESTALVSI